MSNIKKHLKSDIKAPKGAKVAIVVSSYNPDITDALLDSCQSELINRGVLHKNINVIKVPGAFELPHVCRQLVNSKKYHAVIALGCIIKGETPHFDIIAFATAQGIMDLNIEYNIPVIFGVLTPDNLKQAKDRIAGGKRGDKGLEAAISALKMLHINI